MRITLLGTGSADGWPNPFCVCASCAAERAAGRSRRPSSALVDGVLLIDCGPTTPHLPAGHALARVEHVLITHGHPDHLHPAFLLTRRWTSPTSTLHVWGPPLAMDLCRDWIGPDSQVELHPLAPGDSATLETARGAYAVTAVAAAHAHGDGDVMAEEALLFDVTAPDGRRLLYATDTGPLPGATIASLGEYDVLVVDETFGDKADHGTGHLDLTRLPDLLADLREHGAITDATTVVATHLSHHNPPSPMLRERLLSMGVHLVDDLAVIDTDRPQGGLVRRTLVLGGARSGKSTYAEQRASAFATVTYVATGGERPDDAEWAERVARHRARRPDTWSTVETVELGSVLQAASPGTVVLVDCLSLWLTAQLDDIDAWSRCDAGQGRAVQDEAITRMAALAADVADCAAEVVLVSNEVGMGVVPATSAGRLFRDLMGILNSRMSAACDETVLVVAGRPLSTTAGDRRAP